MNSRKPQSISRREFARRAVIASAAASLGGATAVPVDAAAQSAQNGAAHADQDTKLPKLSPEGRAEAEARLQSILSRYGSRFSETQKADLRRLCFLTQQSLDRLRAYPLANGDGPALYLKPLVEREKKPAPAAKVPSKKS
jgi:hypothetical protein